MFKINTKEAIIITPEGKQINHLFDWYKCNIKASLFSISPEFLTSFYLKALEAENLNTDIHFYNQDELTQLFILYNAWISFFTFTNNDYSIEINKNENKIFLFKNKDNCLILSENIEEGFEQLYYYFISNFIF